MSYSITEKYFIMLNYFKHFTVVLFLLGGVLLTMSLQSSFLPQHLSCLYRDKFHVVVVSICRLQMHFQVSEDSQNIK